MRALIATAYGDVENLTVAEVPEPAVGPDDVKVQVHAASINPLDWKLLSGYGRGTPLELHFPAILGRDASGDVIDVGDNVKTLRAGDRVLGFASRTFAERVVAPETAWARVPSGLDLTAAAALPMVSLTGAQLADTVKPRPGMSVLVTGAVGGVGRVAVFVAKMAGATVRNVSTDRLRKTSQPTGTNGRRNAHRQISSRSPERGANAHAAQDDARHSHMAWQQIAR